MQEIGQQLDSAILTYVILLQLMHCSIASCVLHIAYCISHVACCVGVWSPLRRDHHKNSPMSFEGFIQDYNWGGVLQNALTAFFPFGEKLEKLWRKVRQMVWVQNGVIGQSRTLRDKFGHFPKILSSTWRGAGENFFSCILSQNDKWNITTLNVGTKSQIEKKWTAICPVMSIFNRFFDDRLNRVSKNRFFLTTFWNLISIDHSYWNRKINPKPPPGLFYTKFNFEQLSFEPFFKIMCIFGSVEP